MLLIAVTYENSCFLKFGLCIFEGGLNNNDPEYQRNYQLVILPDHVTIPLLSEELPKKVHSTLLCHVCAQNKSRYLIFE